MSFTVDWDARIVDSSASITDVLAAREALRTLESSDKGVLYPPIIKYKELPLGGSAKFLAIEFINGYRLRFPVPGNYTISGGNITAPIIPVSGVYVERITSAAYATSVVTTTEGGGGGAGASVGTGTGATANDIAAAVWSHPFVGRLLTVAKFLGLK